MTSLSESLAAMASKMYALLDRKQWYADSPLAYGYLQVENYRPKQRRRKTRGIELGPKRWISLPRDVKVHSFPLATEQEDEASSKERVPLPSCLKQDVQGPGDKCCSDLSLSLSRSSSMSTTASVSDHRHVHFRDGLEIACDMPDRRNLPHDMGTSLAEWIFVDRDICGVSLYMYDSSEAHLCDYDYFTSSPFGRSFKEELASLHALQSDSASDMGLYDQEEQDLDRSLRQAGVDKLLLVRPNEQVDVVSPRITESQS